jgi:hypothetical protein
LKQCDSVLVYKKKYWLIDKCLFFWENISIVMRWFYVSRTYLINK